MALERYREKRRFDQTPEPIGAEPDPDSASRFVVQKHAARRLHYDLRLEIGGVLRSWAVPKGPSLDPKEKRLAARTEDHPLEYLTFEKTIPQGSYGSGEMIIWDSGTFETEGDPTPLEQLERGELKLVFHGRRLAGGFVLVKARGRKDASGEEWLLIKHQDAAADPDWRIEDFPQSIVSGRTIDDLREGLEADEGAALGPAAVEGAEPAPEPPVVSPMLAASTERPFTDPDWVFELKWDGVRTQARFSGSRLQLLSRNGRDVTSHYPELAELPRAVRAPAAVVDGEIVALDERGRSDFGRLQARMHAVDPGPRLVRETPVVFYAFDLPWLDGYDLREAALVERKRLLEEILHPGPTFRYSAHLREKGEELFELAREHGAEGIIAKRAESGYVSGRSRDWLKIKVVREVDAVIGGFTAPRGGRSHFGALLVGLFDDDGLRFIGGVGSGFDAKTLADLYARLEPLETPDCPFTADPNYKEECRWVEPRLVARVRFGSWTGEGVLRHPVYAGLRPDLDPADCTIRQVQADETAETEPVKRPAVVHAPPVETLPVLSDPEEIEAELAQGRRETVRLDFGERQVRLTHLDKMYFPAAGVTKRRLLDYYYRVAPYLVPFLRDRPLVLHRFPNGVDAPSFYQKDCGDGVPEWMDLHVIPSESRGRDTRYFVCNDTAALLYLVNLGSIEHHPWPSRIDDLESPDYVFFDLDPTPETPYATVVSVARAILDILEEIGLEPFLKTSGSKGMHLWLPLERAYSYDQARAFAEIVARVIHARLPKQTTLERRVEKRPTDAVSLDYSQNAYGRPLATVYSVRPKPAATVSTPIARSELRKNLSIEKFTVDNVPNRLERKGDLWAGFWERRQRIEAALERLTRALGG